MKKKIFIFTLSMAVGLSSFGIINAAKVAGLNAKKIVLTVGKTKKLKVKNVKKVKWSSSNKKIATVNKNGVVKAISKGKVKIIAKTGKGTFTCKVIVRNKKGPASTPAQTTAAAQTISPVTNPTSPAATHTAAPTNTNAADSGSNVGPNNTTDTGNNPGDNSGNQPDSTATASAKPTNKPVETAAPTEEPEESFIPSEVNPEAQITWPKELNNGTTETFEEHFNVDFKGYRDSVEASSVNIETVTYHSDVVGADREIYVYLPPDYDENGNYPVIYMIHGIGARANQWKSMNVGKIFNALITAGEVKPFVAVMPDVIPKDGLGKTSFAPQNIDAFTIFEEEFTKDLEPFILDKYAVSDKPEDTGVCGLSMGGMEALRLGFKIKNHFNYIGSFSAAPTLETRYLNVAHWEFAPKIVLVCSGDNDTTVGDNPYNYHMKLTQNEVEHLWYYYPGGTHSGDVWLNGATNFVQLCFGDKVSELGGQYPAPTEEPGDIVEPTEEPGDIVEPTEDTEDLEVPIEAN
ncbi:MAG: Ig-like domain-containing protein [Lachnospiraceae bacterium]|nr:Ig-like domain-containing protein [Lachnospiraceae bacterium]